MAQLLVPRIPTMLDPSKYLSGRPGQGGALTAPPVVPSVMPKPYVAPTLADPKLAVPRNLPSDKAQPTTGVKATMPSALVKVQTRADRINNEKRRYLYGGGHGRPSKVGDGKPIDCSAAVSLALGRPVQVSGDFGNWGRPGRAKGKGAVNVYYNQGHVFMEINGHFWGTSGTNPGGGAGWIPRSVMNSGYLSGFKVRHLRYK